MKTENAPRAGSEQQQENQARENHRVRWWCWVVPGWRSARGWSSYFVEHSPEPQETTNFALMLTPLILSAPAQFLPLLLLLLLSHTFFFFEFIPTINIYISLLSSKFYYIYFFTLITDCTTLDSFCFALFIQRGIITYVDHVHKFIYILHTFTLNTLSPSWRIRIVNLLVVRLERQFPHPQINKLCVCMYLYR